MSTPLPHRPQYAGLATTLVVLAVLGLSLWAGWGWLQRQPFWIVMQARAELQALPAPSSQPVPVDGVRAADIADTWGAPRGADRTHQGVDIFAARGTPVRSATRGIVLSMRESGLGGRQVWVFGPAGERHYYAHLDDWSPALAEGQVIDAGTALGTVGDTGNARGTPPHLHYGVYGADGALDPLPRLQAHGAVAPASIGASPD